MAINGMGEERRKALSCLTKDELIDKVMELEREVKELWEPTLEDFTEMSLEMANIERRVKEDTLDKKRKPRNLFLR